jgi:CheY-like chemotaxis protein
MMRILVVDDNLDGARSLVLLLAAMGHEARMANGGGVAVKEYGLFKPQLVFLDIGMSGMDGYETCRVLRRMAGAMPLIVAVTGRDSEEDRQRSAEAGFEHHLVKPVAIGAIEEMLQHALARHTAL